MKLFWELQQARRPLLHSLYRHRVPNITTLTTAVLLPSCILSTQEAASARGVGGGVCEIVSGQREGVGGHSLPLCQPGARCLGRDRWPHQGHQRPNTGWAEENCLGGAGPPVDTHTQTQNKCVAEHHKTSHIMFLCNYIYAQTQKYTYGHLNSFRLKINALYIL